MLRINTDRIRVFFRKKKEHKPMSEKLNYKTIDDLDSFFSKVDLYTDIVFSVYKTADGESLVLDEKELKRLYGVLDINKTSIDSYCVFCEKEYPFDVSFWSSESRYIRSFDASHSVVSFGEEVFIDTSKFKGSNLPGSVDNSQLYDFHIVYLTYELKCNKHNSHIYQMYIVLFITSGKVTIRKIGQFPSKIDIWGFDFEKYKSQLNKFDAYPDFKKAELCMSDKLFAGAFTYLRRVFEKMLNSYCDDSELLNKRTEEKIEACKGRFDPRVKSLLKNLYGILSAGIHQLSDEQSEEYYIDLRTVIELQLEYIKELNDREEQTKKLKDRIDKISNDIK